MSGGRTRRRAKQQIERMSIPELEKIIRINAPEMRRLATLVSYAERELQRRHRDELPR